MRRAIGSALRTRVRKSMEGRMSVRCAAGAAGPGAAWTCGRFRGCNADSTSGRVRPLPGLRCAAADRTRTGAVPVGRDCLRPGDAEDTVSAAFRQVAYTEPG